MQTNFSTLCEILQYELWAAERYRRYVSLVMVHAPIGIHGLKDTLDANVRQSDVLAYTDHTMVVLMGETDKNDALQALERYNGFLGNQFEARFSLVTYPADDASADALIGIAERRLQQAKSGGAGTVVCSG